jgi:pyruvate formate lyase activating enzyme
MTAVPGGRPDMGARSALASDLARRTVAGALARPLPGRRLECVACAHRCALPDGAVGRCGVRFRRGEELRVPFGDVAARRVMPVERNTISSPWTRRSHGT